MAITEKQKKEIVLAYYANEHVKAGWLDDLSIKICLPKTSISRYARSIGMTNKSRRKEDAKCIVCKKKFKQNTTKQTCCSKQCGNIAGARKRTGKHLWEKRPHPRGMKGKAHSKEYCAQLSRQTKAQWEDPHSKLNSEAQTQRRSDQMSARIVEIRKKAPESIYSRTTKGWREIGDKKYYFRSKWEMNIAYYLEWLRTHGEILYWEYEPKTFWFEQIRRGTRSYLPDFFVREKNGSEYYIEVKGWMDQKSRTKMARMKKYYPNVEVRLYDEDTYKTLKKQVGRLCNFE